VSEEQNDIVHVEILGRTHSIRSQLGTDYVTKLASYVDQKMQTALDGSSTTFDKEAVAVLAAINIADEYFRCLNDRTTNDTSIKQRAIDIETILDEAISKIQGSSD